MTRTDGSGGGYLIIYLSERAVVIVVVVCSFCEACSGVRVPFLSLPYLAFPFLSLTIVLTCLLFLAMLSDICLIVLSVSIFVGFVLVCSLFHYLFCEPVCFALGGGGGGGKGMLLRRRGGEAERRRGGGGGGEAEAESGEGV
ncbi:hypothetical protein HETIRDRAFT_328583 [Heterobasidion irregulare TC 32-1]|uniref:Uncharacterized protein n=1 Tax=Heterobasidion irregulare (strain TC 32-1) TaxID=747525 RepID=W4JU14_HETIT|nr:uncharacterized protein HETIRDRAFT_328583 [Heterobasidion irregulare TC 32-1]ETW76585.1 hypothetical protein HETIRDRAFT_328583 [Heterobasidion irregulare TC 32-1]